ncbi:hypothetical protein SLEP1_g51816 [Rubroshorea leprosula]|uniref:Uncharacterized protein n=1 Tax=Rubroshorea leprosula TaxID=152421 RepID=A0AAV5M609_9ROSI|nr:hypothetical protein SLEP1_g51816 [Rubroshorea leprosula]
MYTSSFITQIPKFSFSRSSPSADLLFEQNLCRRRLLWLAQKSKFFCLVPVSFLLHSHPIVDFPFLDLAALFKLTHPHPPHPRSSGVASNLQR